MSDDPPIATRTPSPDPGTSTPEVAREILGAIDGAMEEHTAWLRKWHRAVVCGLPPVREVVSKHAEYLGRFGSWFDTNSGRNLLDQPVFRELWLAHVETHDLGRLLAIKSVDGELVPVKEYDAFMEKVDRFAIVARRIRDAFQRAVFDLDPLTGVHNRRSMMAELRRERERSLRTASPLCVGLCDIDHFKRVNDNHGHGVGDIVLVTAAGRMIANIRPYDSIFRYGGEEFLLMLPNANEVTAIGIAERLREALSATPIEAGAEISLNVTASFGLCLVDKADTLEVSIEQADKALYRAKHEGRNRVVMWDGEDREDSEAAAGDG